MTWFDFCISFIYLSISQAIFFHILVAWWVEPPHTSPTCSKFSSLSGSPSCSISTLQSTSPPLPSSPTFFCSATLFKPLYPQISFIRQFKLLPSPYFKNSINIRDYLHPHLQHLSFDPLLLLSSSCVCRLRVAHILLCHEIRPCS